MATLHITLTNEDKGYRFSDFSEDVDDEYTNGDLFRMLRREYGRCVSKVYVGDDDQAGWYFESRQRYEDTGQPYIRGAWCIVDRAA